MPLPGASEDVSQTARLADELAMAIHLGDLKPGAPLREVDLAEAHGVSRTIVRAALQRLEAQGLADIVLNKGARVRSVKAEAVPDLIDLHADLAALAARNAAVRADASAVALMRRFVDMMDHVAAEGAAAREVQHLRVGFMRTLFEAAGPTLAERLRVAAPVVPHHDNALGDIFSAVGQKEVARLARDILTAVARHDAEAAARAAETLVLRHGERTREVVMPTPAQRGAGKRNRAA
jgi:DNA-binding GntR family transcriptional regulator